MSEADAAPDENWRAISPEEAAVIRSILSQADIRRSGPLIADLNGALVANETTWILDIKVSNNDEGADLPNGLDYKSFPGLAGVFLEDSYFTGLWATDRQRGDSNARLLHR